MVHTITETHNKKNLYCPTKINRSGLKSAMAAAFINPDLKVGVSNANYLPVWASAHLTGQ